jgi:hypothetical protein
MQTFLPYPDFARSAACLDRARLGKQRVECLQILKACFLWTKGWSNHPAVRMWRGYEDALYHYHHAVVSEWRDVRGYKDTTSEKAFGVFMGETHCMPSWDPGLPPWLGSVEFHRSHQSNLIRKDPEHYGPLFPGVSDDLPYVWPVDKDGACIVQVAGCTPRETPDTE